MIRKFYARQLRNLFGYHVQSGKKILQLYPKNLDLITSLNPSKATVVVRKKTQKYSNKDVEIVTGDPHNFSLKEKFDYIILSDSIGNFDDIQKVFENLRSNCTSETRIIISYYNYLWEPLLKLGEAVGLKSKQKITSWLSKADMKNLLELADFETIKQTNRVLLPIYIPLVSHFCNKYLAHLPLLNKLTLINGFVARPINLEEREEMSVSILVPAMNEEGNIEPIVKTLPDLGKGTEIIFVEGGSKDNTWKEIQRVQKKYSEKNIVSFQQDGKGKGDAVRKGFDNATGDILMIYDADRTVPEKDLYKFYEALVSNKGEFVFGSRLIYPMEKEAMRFLNLLGNKFFSMTFSWILNQPIKDTLCGTKVLTRENYLRLIANREYFGDFDPFGDFDLIFGSAKLDLKMTEIPIRYKARTYGETNISRFSHGWLLLKMVFFSLRKIKFIK